jgi:DNA primase
MSPLIKDKSVQAVLQAANIVDVVSGYTSLRKRGATYTGLCPFHQEKTPSFTVSADKGLYYCFGCGEGGDVVRFLERIENLSFFEVIEQLAERYGVPLEFEEGKGPEAGSKDREARLLLLLEKTATFYQRFLWETESGRVAREYLKRRGLGEEVCRAFRVGYSPEEWRGLHGRAAKEGFSDRELEQAGLVVRHTGRVYDRFRGRLMFPLIDHRGRVVGFGGRTLKDENPKYLNSPEGPLYQKGHLLYGLYQARRAIADADEVIVVEGYTDVLGLVQAGTANVVASMGTALTEAQLGLMTRFTKNITFMFDADRAGTEAVLRSGELARRQSLRPLVALLPAGKDPADVAITEGAAGVQRTLAAKTSLLRFELGQALERGDISTAEGRVKAFEEVRRIMAGAGSAKEREEEIPLIADRLRLTPESVALLLRGGVPRRRVSPAGGAAGSAEEGSRPAPRGARSTGGTAVRGERERPAGVSLSQRLLAQETAVERDFLVAAVCHPERGAVLLEALTPDHFADPSNREVFGGVREAFALLAAGGGRDARPAAMERLKARATGDSEAGRLFVRLVMEADQGRYALAVLEELHLRLQEQYLRRAIAALRGSLEAGEESAETEQRLFHLERLLQAVRSNLLQLDPEEGRSEG